MVAGGKVGGGMGQGWVCLVFNVGYFLFLLLVSCFLRRVFFLLLGHAFTV